MPDPLPPRRSPFARAHDAVQLVGLSFFLAVSLAAFARGAESAGTAVLVHAGLLGATAWIAARADSPREMGPALSNLHLVWPLPVLSTVFASIRWLNPAVATPGRIFDERLWAIDRDWFGVDIARWSEGFLTAPVADLFMVFYALYFLMPVVLLGALILRGERPAIYRTTFTIAVGLYACYALYMLVPAAGPRNAYVGRSAPLPEGLLTRWTHDVIRDLEPQAWDAFPSAHVVMGLLCAALAWRLGGWIRWSMAAVAAGTVLSTLVLRYHYLVDDVVGILIAVGALAAAAFLARRAERKAATGAHGDRMGDLLAPTGSAR